MPEVVHRRRTCLFVTRRRRTGRSGVRVAVVNERRRYQVVVHSVFLWSGIRSTKNIHSSLRAPYIARDRLLGISSSRSPAPIYPSVHPLIAWQLRCFRGEQEGHLSKGLGILERFVRLFCNQPMRQPSVCLSVCASVRPL